MSQTLHVRCLVCGEVLAYQREETSPLLVHLRSRHPTLNIGRLDPIPTDDPYCDLPDYVKPREQLFRQGNLQGIKDPCEPVDRERDILRKLNQGGPCDRVECRRQFRLKRSSGRPCDPTDCLRQFQASNLGRPCDPPDCQRIFRERVMQGENPLQESETKRKPALKKVGCKPYCRVFDTSDKSYPNFLPCGCGPGDADKDGDPCGCDPICEPRAQLAKGDWKRSLSAGRVNKRLRKEHNKKLYQTTVETWKPGNNKIVCPKCGYDGQPVVRRMRNKVYHSSLGAVLMLGCWPMCFLPFMLCGTNVVNLYCAQCNRFLGTYDRKRNVLVEKDMNQACSASTVQSHRSEPTICACKTDCQE